jgi:hypothetical protein
MIRTNAQRNYYIAPYGISFVENALGNPALIQVSVSIGTTITAYEQGVIGYAGNKNYREWKLTGYNTRLVNAAHHYIYARVGQSDSSADGLIIFSTKNYNTDGSIQGDSTSQASTEYFYIKIGEVTATNAELTSERELTYDSGCLTSDETRNSSSGLEEMFELDKSGTPWLIRAKQFLAGFTVKGYITLLNGLLFKGGEKLTGLFTSSSQKADASDETAVTSKYLLENYLTLEEMDARYLSKLNDDTAHGKITFEKGLEAQGDVSVSSGNVEVKEGNVNVKKGNLTVEQAMTYLNGGLQIGTDFAEGMTGFGNRIDKEGNAQLLSLTLLSFLQVPEIRYNRTTVTIGNDWGCSGGGIIEEVTPDTDSDGKTLETGIIRLHLEDGEPGAVAVNDLCQGIYHSLNSSENATETSDDSRGNFLFAGFFTCYFRVTELLKEDGSEFRYTLRAKSERWPYQWHPTAQMHFAGYGNTSDKDRQTSRYATTKYIRFLQNVDDWEFDANNVVMQLGDCSNLEVFGKKDMANYSAYLNSVYFSGVIEQLADMPRTMIIERTLGEYMAPGETCVVTCTVYDGYNRDVTSDYIQFQVVRESGDSASDELWNSTHMNVGNVFLLSFADLGLRLATQISTKFTVYAIPAEGSAVGTSFDYGS